MKKTLSFEQIETIYNLLGQHWDETIKEVHLPVKQVYNLVSLKKMIEGKHQLIQDSVMAIMKTHGAFENEQGALQVPQESIAETNAELMKLSTETEEVDYQNIIIKETDSFPSILLDVLFDFIIIE